MTTTHKKRKAKKHHHHNVQIKESPSENPELTAESLEQLLNDSHAEAAHQEDSLNKTGEDFSFIFGRSRNTEW